MNFLDDDDKQTCHLETDSGEKKNRRQRDPELKAIEDIMAMMDDMELGARQRVMAYLLVRYKIANIFRLEPNHE